MKMFPVFGPHVLDFVNQIVPAAYRIQTEINEGCPYDKHDDHLHHICHDYRCDSSEKCVKPHYGCRDDDRGPYQPAHQYIQQNRTEPKKYTKIHGKQQNPGQGSNGADRSFVTSPEIFRDGVHSSFPEIRNENKSSQQHGRHRTDPVKVSDRYSVSICLPGHSDEIKGTYIRYDDGHTDSPEGEAS